MYIALNGALPYDGKTVEKVLELFLIKLQMFCLLYTSRPLVTPGFTALVEEQKSFPQKSFDLRGGSPAEQEQHVLLKRIQVDLGLNNRGKTVDSLAEIRAAHFKVDPAERSAVI